MIPWTKIASVALPLITAGVAIISGKVDDAKLDEKVTEKVAEALSKENK